MATWLEQGIAVEIKLGPFVSDSDGYTPQTALTIVQADVRLAKIDGNWAQKFETTSAVHEENGWYRVLLNATDTGTGGCLMVAVHKSGCLPVWREFMVMNSNPYQSLVNGSISDYLKVDLVQVQGTAAATPPTAAAVAAAVWDEDATAHQTAGTFGKAIGDPGANTNTIYGAVVTDAASATVGVDTAYLIAAMDGITGGFTTVVVGSVVPNAINASALATDAATEIADAVWGLSTTGHSLMGTFGAQAKTLIDTINSDTNTIKLAVDTEVAAIKAKTDQLAFTTANRVDSQVYGMATDTITNTAISVAAIAEIQGGLATSVALATVQADTDDIQARLPGALIAGRMNSSTGDVQSGVINADALSTDAVNAIADALLDRANGVETGVTPRGALRLAASALAGKVSGAGTTTNTFRNVGDSKNRITSTVDGSGNRTAVTTDTT